MKQIFALIALSFLLVLPSVHAKGSFLYQSSEGEIVKDGDVLDYGAGLVVDDGDYAYETYKNGETHVVFNGKDMGPGYRPQIDDGKILFERADGLKNVIVFEGKEYGEGYDPITRDGHFVFFRRVHSDNLRDAYQGSIIAYYDGKYYCDGADEEIQKKIDFAGKHVICEQAVQNDGSTKSFIVYNGRVIDEGYSPKASEKHYAYMKKEDFGNEKDVEFLVVNKEAYRGGYDLEFSEDSYMFFRENFEGEIEVVLNGKNLGTFYDSETLIFEDGHVAFYREHKDILRKATGEFSEVSNLHVYYDGIDRGVVDEWSIKTNESKKVFLSGGHIAFERTVEGDYIDENGEFDQKDFTYVVFDGRARTSIIPGTLRMKDGTFAFAKEVDVYEDDVEGYVKKNYIYKGKKDGSIKRLGQGDPDSIVIGNGKVAYTKKDDVTRKYLKNGQYENIEIEMDVIMIDGSNKGVGNIATLVMDNGSYGFGENKNGRWYLTVNGATQAHPAAELQIASAVSAAVASSQVDHDLLTKMVYFLDGSSKSSKKTVSISDSGKTEVSGTLLQKSGRYYLKLENKKYIRLVPKTGLSISAYTGKGVKVTVEKKKYKTSKSKKVFTAYKVHSIVQDHDVKKKTTTTAKKINKSGVLDVSGVAFSLKNKGKKYKLRLIGVSKEDMFPLVGDTVTVEAIKKGLYYEVYSVK